ncbi:DNA polymerase III subunit delta [Bacteroidia bacterium]|nr:DNA polymerase III subunit delta [Bacteroidia bacterium]
MLFKNIIGQDDIKRQLVQSVQKGLIPHARLISGRLEDGILPVALAYARYLHCTNRQETDACGVCPSCQQFNKWAHPDLHFVFPIINKKGTKDAYCDDFLPEWRQFLSETPTGDLSAWLSAIEAGNSQGMIYEREADEIVQKLNLKAYESDYKIMIIWLPEKMNVVAANKLLKLLEEPPAKTVFLLVSEDPEKLLPTVRSRVQMLMVPPIFENTAVSGDDEAFLDMFITIMRNSWTRNVVNMKAKADQFASMGRDRQKGFLAYSQRMIRENFLYPLHLSEMNRLNTEEAKFSVNFYPYIKSENVVDFVKELALAEQHVEANVNPRMIFFDLSMKIAVLLKK